MQVTVDQRNDANPEKLVSVVVPTFNMAQWLPDALDSIAAQTYTQLECIVVDDGSSDNSRVVVDSYIRGDRRFRYIFKESGGPSSARNTGIKASRGEFVAFLDADDIWLPKKLEKQMAALTARPEAGLCCTYYEEVDENLNLINTWPIIKQRNGYPDEICSETLAENISCCLVPGSASAAVVRKVCFEELGLFDARLRIGEDLDMWYRIALKFPIIQEREVLVRVRKVDKQDSTERIRRILKDLELIVDKIRQSAPQAHQALVERADYNRLWGAFGFCMRRCYFLLASELLVKMIIKNPARTVAQLGRSVRNLILPMANFIFDYLAKQAFFFS
jgi:glycosyltransferase involved in cell wall biosynthesis